MEALGLLEKPGMALAGEYPNPLAAGEWSPADLMAEDRERQEREQAQWFNTNLETVHKAALDPDGFYEGKDLSFARSRKEGQDLAISDAYLALMNGGEAPGGDSLGRRMYMQEVALKRWDKVINTDAEFAAEVAKEAQAGKDERELLAGSDEESAGKSLAGVLREAAMTGGDWRASFLQWQKGAEADARFKPDRLAIYQEAARAIFEEESRQVEAVRPIAEEALAALVDEQGRRGAYGGATAIAAIEKAPKEQRALAIALLFRAAEKEGDKQGKGGHAWQTFARGLARQMVTGPSSTMAARDLVQAEEMLGKIQPGDEFGGRFDNLLAAAKGNNSGSLEGRMLGVILEPLLENQTATAESIAAAKQELQRQKDRFELSKQLEGIAQGSLDPLRPDGWFQQKITYPFLSGVAPSVASVVLTRRMTGSGFGAVVPMWGMMADDNAQQYLRQNPGMSFAQAYQLGERAAYWQSGLEYAETALTLGNGKLLGNALKTARASAFKTFGKAVLTNLAGHNLLEGVQDVIPYFVQELDATAPGANAARFFYGEDGEPGYWTQRVDTFLALLPAVAMGAGGATIQSKASRPELERAAAATRNEALLKAAGIGEEARAKIVAEGDARRRLNLFSGALKFADPEVAREGQAELDAARERAESALEEAQAAGIVPRAVKVGERWSVFDPETGDLVGQAATPADASSLVETVMGEREEADANEVAYMASLLEFGEKVTAKGDGSGERTVLDFQAGDEMALERIAARSAQDEARIMEQVRAREALGETVSMSDLVLGESVTEMKRGVREMALRIYRGGSVLTLGHEDAHRLLRKAQGKGMLLRDDLIQLGRAVQSVMGDKTTKDGRPLRVLPENDAEITDTMLDEMVAELWESELLRRRKTGGPYGMSAGIISRNLTALSRIAAGPVKTFKAMVDAYRAMFGLATARAHEMRKGIKEGKIEEAKLDEFVSRMSGLTEQDDLDAEAARHAEEILGGDVFEGDPFSLGRGFSATSQAKQAEIMAGLAGMPGNLREVRGSDQVKALRGEIAGEEMTNLATGFVASVSGQSFHKMLSQSAVARSVSGAAHLRAVANIDRLFPLAILEETRAGKRAGDEESLSGIHHFIAPMPHAGEVLQVRMMAKEFKTAGQGARLYLVQAVEIEKVTPPSLTGDTATPEGSDAPHRPGGVEETFARMAAVVKEAMEGGAFALAGSKVADALRRDAISRIKDPVRRTQVMSRVARKMEEARLEIERIELTGGTRRVRRSLAKEAAMREALRLQELENETWARHMAVLSDEDLTKLKAQPGHALLSDPKSPLRGRLMSRTAAMKRYPHAVELRQGGEYDGSEGVSRSVFGGDLMPDQAAQEMYEMGLIKEPSPDAMWMLLEAESKSVAKMREFLETAKEELREGRLQAKDETNAWLRQQEAVQKDPEQAFSNKQEIVRMMGLLDGILSAVPAVVRGKVGGYTQLARLGTNESRLKFLKERMAKMDHELEAWMREQYNKEFFALLERSRPEKDEAGQKPKGKIGADVHELFASLREAMLWTAGEAEAEALKLEALAASGEYTPEQESHLTLQANLVRLVGDWGKADAARREAALVEATRIYESGYLQHRIEVTRKRERRQERRGRMKGATKSDGAREARRAREKQDTGTKPGRIKRIKASLLSFEQLLQDVFGLGSEDADFLANWERRASNAKSDAIQNKLDAIEDLFATLAGSKFKGEALRWKMSRPDAITIDGQSFSELEAITATLMWRQEDGRRHMEGYKDENGNPAGEWNYTQAFMDKLEAKLSPQAKAVRLHLGEQYAAEYERLNAIYRDLYGVSLPRHKFYSPLTVKPQQAPAGQLTDPVTGFAMTGNGFTPGSLRSRSQSAVAEPEFRDAVQTYIAHVRQMEHWMAYAPFATEAMALLNTRDLGNAVEAAAGKESLSVLRSWLDYFAQGGTKDASAHLAINETWNRVTSRFAAMALVGRVSVLAIQSLQLGAGLAQMPTGAYLSRFARLMTGRLGWGAALQSDFIQRRKSQMPAVVQQALEGLKSGKPGKVKHFVRRLGETIPGADALFTAGTFAMIYDYQLGQAKKLGLQGAEAEAFAREEAERGTERVAQPVRPGARSFYEVSASDPARRILWAFASDARQKFALSVLGHSERTAGEKARALAVTWLVGGVVATVIRTMMRDLRDDGEDDEVFDERNWDPGRFALSALTGPLGGMPLFGEMIEGTAFAAAGEYVPAGTLLDTGKNAVQAAKHVPDWFSGERDLDGALKDAEAMMTLSGLASDSAAAATSIMHLVRDFFAVGENVTE